MARKVLLLVSYCGPNNDNGCSDDFPCDECLKMCNVVEVDSTDIIRNFGSFDYNKEVNFYKVSTYYKDKAIFKKSEKKFKVRKIKF